MLSEETMKKILKRKDAIVVRYGEQVSRRILAGFIPGNNTAQILKLPEDAVRTRAGGSKG